MTRLYIDLNTLQIGTKRKLRPPKVDPVVMSERARSGVALRAARALAALHGVDIEKEGPGEYWVTHPDLMDTGNDPCEGNHFCTDGREVLECVQTYANHFSTTAKKGTP